MATLDELKAKLQSIINEYKVVSKEKNKVFGKTAANIDKYYFIIQDGQLSQNAAGQWTAKRTITAMVVTDVTQKNGYSNVYAEVLGANGQPVLVSPAQADGEIPATAKDAKDKNLLALAAKLKENSSTSYTVDLIWDIANPNDKPNPNPQEPFYYEIVDSDFKEVEKGQKWTAKRTITKKSATTQGAKNVYKNVYSREKGDNSPQVLNGEGELPNDAKSSSHKNFEKLIPKMKGETLTVDLVWDEKPTDEEIKEAIDILTRTRPISSLEIGSTNSDGSLHLPKLVHDAQSIGFLRPAINAILVLKRAGYKSFTINFTWTKPLKYTKITQTDFDRVVNTACSEYIRGLILYSKGQLNSSDFRINARAIFSQDETGSYVSSVTPQR